ncbi:FAD assembly factor SdhE [Legionella sp. CNM-4043-24]|uniref:FAD assembly factor SdhE n=1 Tax=Legionella sp. CNM-4043-24 TaxID=3421646 RepID=UPI00403B2DF8
MIDAARKAKINWQCRRGMLELDLVLNPFVQNELDGLNEQQINTLERLLEEADPVLYSWLMNSSDPDDKELTDLVELIRRHGHTR